MSSTVNTSGTPDHHMKLEWDAAERVLTMVWSPFLLLFGVPGNMLIVVSMSSIWPHVPAYLFLLAQAVSDLGILTLGLLPRWVCRTIDYCIFDISDLTCKFFQWENLSNGMVTSFLIMGVTLFRAVSVSFPYFLLSHRVTHGTVSWIVAGLTTTPFLINTWALVHAQIVKGECEFSPTFMEKYGNFISVINAVFFSGLTTLVTILSYAALLYAMHNSTARLTRMERRKSAYIKQRRKITRTIILKSVVFVVLFVPTTVERIVVVLQPQLKTLYYYRFVKRIPFLMWYTHAAVSFYIYLCTMADLRENFVLRMRTVSEWCGSSCCCKGKVAPSTASPDEAVSAMPCNAHTLSGVFRKRSEGSKEPESPHPITLD